MIYPIHIKFDTAALSSAEAPAGYRDKNTVDCLLFINYHKFYRKQYPLPAVCTIALLGPSVSLRDKHQNELQPVSEH